MFGSPEPTYMPGGLSRPPVVPAFGSRVRRFPEQAGARLAKLASFGFDGDLP